MSILDQTAKGFLESTKNLSHDELNKKIDTLPKNVQERVWELQKESYFVPANKLGEPTVHVSASQKYKLVVQQYETKKGYARYSRGLVYKGDTLVGDIKRNYCAFPFLFIEDHPNGHDYLVCGEDYQGQTVLELDTGMCSIALSEDADKGWGFCWSSYQFNKSAQVLVVDGCIWACPYEFRLYDFSDPMKSRGWPELKTEELIDADAIPPEINDDGTIVFWKSRENEDGTTSQAVASVTYKRVGDTLEKIGEWVSEDEAKLRAQIEEENRQYEEYQKNFRLTDPLFLEYKRRLTEKFSPETYEGWGITFDGWCPDFKMTEKRFCRRVVKQKDLTIDIEWATETGPIKLNVYKSGKLVSTTFYAHSVEGMQEAFTFAETWMS